MNLKQFLDDRICAALEGVGAPGSPAVVKQASKPEFGHYQANGVMGAAKKLKARPAELAALLTGKLDLTGVAATEVAGPGFINITLSPAFIASALQETAQDARLGVAAATPETIVVDYSSPNLAKEMHIGHLRSTAIGDAAVRILEFLGHNVIRANHVGDWGAQFGSLLAYMNRLSPAGETLATELKDLEAFYRSASQLFKNDEAFAAQARQYVVRLQSGDAGCLALWRQFINESLNHCDAVYRRLGISLAREDVMAESAYNDGLPDVISRLREKGLITESDGALCVFLPEFTGKDGEALPAIVRKSDGGYPYMATDLAAVRHRTEKLRADRALYFVDGRQSLHLKQLFAVSRAAGLLGDQDFRHVAFGAILNKAGKPFKTREGDAVKLADVADEAVSRAARLVAEKNPHLAEGERQEIAEVVGIGAIKYAELSKNRATDYIFDWDTMLSFEGNTAPYLQYAYTRIRSIFRRAGIEPEPPGMEQGDELTLTEPAELTLAVKILQYPETIEAVIDDYQANMLTNYLFELAGMFMSFYEACPVLKAGDGARQSRLLLCRLTADVLKHGLSLLGIGTVERM